MLRLFYHRLRRTCRYCLELPSAAVVGGVSALIILHANLVVAQPSGAITGSVKSSATGLPLQGVTVRALALDGPSAGATPSATTGTFGGYTITGLLPASYVLFTNNSGGHVDEIDNNVTCIGRCEVLDVRAKGTPTVVTAGTATTAREFQLDIGGSVTGRVVDPGTGNALANIDVSLYVPGDERPRFVRSDATDASGSYAIEGLAAAQYYAFTSNFSGYLNVIYSGVLCPGRCEDDVAVASGAPIPVSLGTTSANRDFALPRGGAVSGRVTDAATGVPLQNVGVAVFTRQGADVIPGPEASTSASGNYTITGVPGGTVEVFSSGWHGYANEIYGGSACVGDCEDVAAISAGTPISVAAGGTTGGIDFALDAGGRIAGTVSEAGTGQPVANAEVEILAIVGGVISQADSVQTDSAGAFVSRAGLAAGSYLAAAFSGQGYVSEIYDNRPCFELECIELALSGGATPISVTLGGTTSNRDFALDPGGSISGTVTSLSGGGLGNVQVVLYRQSSSGLRLATAEGGFTNQAGVYQYSRLTPGTYYLATQNTRGYADEIYADVACDGACRPADVTALGSPVVVAAGAVRSGIDFALRPRTEPGSPQRLRASIVGFTVTLNWEPPAPGSGGVPSGYVLEAGASSGTTTVSVPTNALGLAAPGVSPGRYFVRVRGVNAFGAGPASEEIVLDIGADGLAPLAAPQNVRAFMDGPRLTVTWSPPSGGLDPPTYVVEAGTAGGLANIATLQVVGSSSFSYFTVPPGTYFLRVRARRGGAVGPASEEVMLSVGGAPAPPGPPVGFAATVAGSTVTFNWSPPVVGVPTSYRLEAGSDSGLSNIAVFNTGSPATTVSFAGVPPGRYFVRLRAVSGAGTGLASGEIVLEVP